jgi:hypothetical protein
LADQTATVHADKLLSNFPQIAQIGILRKLQKYAIFRGTFSWLSGSITKERPI